MYAAPKFKAMTVANAATTMSQTGMRTLYKTSPHAVLSTPKTDFLQRQDHIGACAIGLGEHEVRT